MYMGLFANYRQAKSRHNLQQGKRLASADTLTVLEVRR